MDVCRICLAKKPEKDILQLRVSKKDDKTTYADILLFCLNIEVELESKISTKLCLKCFKKVITFYKFKSIALKNDSYLKSLDLKNEIYISTDEIEIKAEEVSMSEESQDTLVKEEFNEEARLKVDDHIEPMIESDDEFLSAVKQIKYEYVEEITENGIKLEISPRETENTLPLQKGRRNKVTALTKRKKNTKATSKQNHHGPKRMCAVCGKTVNDLKAHSYLHLPMGERKRVKCRLCDKTFSSHSARYKHNKVKHLGIKQKCNICNKVVTHLKQHNLVVHDKDSLRYECLECGRRFVSNSSLELHMRGHTKDRPFPCELCEKKFSTKVLALQHKRSVHDKEKPHLCQLCSKSFFKKYHLQVHLRSHSKERTHECPDCGKFYKTESTLKNHRETHIIERKHACQLCSQTFVKRGYLRAHMISHMKEKRYPCRYCDVKFHRSDHRKRHEFTAHQKHLIATTNTST